MVKAKIGWGKNDVSLRMIFMFLYEIEISVSTVTRDYIRHDANENFQNNNSL